MPTWTDVKEQSSGYFFSDKTMGFFSSRLNGQPKRGEDGSYYGVVSSKPPHGGRYYEIVRVKPDGETCRAHPADDPYGARQLRYNTREKAISALGYLLSDKVDEPSPSDFIWY